MYVDKRSLIMIMIFCVSSYFLSMLTCSILFPLTLMGLFQNEHQAAIDIYDAEVRLYGC